LVSIYSGQATSACNCAQTLHVCRSRRHFRHWGEGKGGDENREESIGAQMVKNEERTEKATLKKAQQMKGAME